MKLWAGRFQKETDTLVNDFNSSIQFDARLYKQDIAGSIAHAQMLGKQGIIEEHEAEKIVEGLKGILKDIEDGKVEFSLDYEDIHMNVEQLLTERIGDTGKRLHTGRSRNDQVALDMRLYVKKEIKEIIELILGFMKALTKKSRENLDAVMPGYTHLQRAQPTTFAHYMMAYANMLKRDITRLQDCYERMDEMPLGSGALASTTYPIDREVYTEGWAENGAIVDEHEVEGYRLRLRYQGVEAGPLFWAHYSFLGLDPRGLRDDYCEDYFGEMRNYSLINRAYCIRNPRHYKGYGKDCWGLTASYSTAGYAAHAPVEREDRGVIAPTAALSSIVYTPEESMDVMRYLYGPLHEKVWGPYGFYDAFSQTDDWYPQKYLAIDQGPIAVMIENHRSELLWRLFMSHPDVQNGLRKLGFESPVLQ